MNEPRASQIRIAVMWRGDTDAPDRPASHEAKLLPVIEALQAQGLHAKPIVYFDDRVETIERRLLGCDGILVWINPIQNGRDRATVDAMLRRLVTKGVWVSADPRTIDVMGTKEVLYATRDIGWALDAERYDSLEQFAKGFPDKLRTGPRVLKPRRGNDGQGVVKVKPCAQEGFVNVQHASDDRAEKISMSQLSEVMRPIFARGECVVDQEFNANANAGMVRCYMSLDRVVGLGIQRPRTEGDAAFGMASAKEMRPPDDAEFRILRDAMEREWVPQMQQTLDLSVERLPVLWDADFLIRAGKSRNPYALCEINVSCVSPFPPGAPAAVAAAAKRITSARR